MGAIVCKLDRHRGTVQRGYIAMLAVDKDFRKKSWCVSYGGFSWAVYSKTRDKEE